VIGLFLAASTSRTCSFVLRGASRAYASLAAAKEAGAFSLAYGL